MNAVGGTAAPFHDKEALQQQIRRLRKEKTALQADQVELEGRIEQASANLIELKKRQVQLKTAKEVAEEQSKGKAASGLPKSEFSVQERLLELSLLNGELEKSQSALESEAKRCQELAKQAQDALASSQRKYDAMPMRFKQTLAEAQAEVKALEDELSSLESDASARQKRCQGNTATAQQDLEALRAELEEVSEELEEATDSRDAWSHRLQIEKAQADLIGKQRQKQIEILEGNFGEDAIAYAAFGSVCRGDDLCVITDIASSLLPYFGCEWTAHDEEVVGAIKRRGLQAGQEGTVTRREYCQIVKELRAAAL